MRSRPRRGFPRQLVWLILIGALVTTPGCLVLGLDRFYDDPAITFDERLLGAWKDTDDNVTVTVERSEWRSYRVTYAHATDNGAVTAYLFTCNGGLCLDLTPLRGQDPGPLVLVGHAMARLTVAATQITVTPLSHDWFSAALVSRSLAPTLAPTRSERDQVLLTAPGAAVREWMATRPADDQAFGPAAVFTRQ